MRRGSNVGTDRAAYRLCRRRGIVRERGDPYHDATRSRYTADGRDILSRAAYPLATAAATFETRRAMTDDGKAPARDVQSPGGAHILMFEDDETLASLLAR